MGRSSTRCWDRRRATTTLTASSQCAASQQSHPALTFGVHAAAQYSNLYLLAMCRSNVNATAILLFLHRLLDVFKHYFSEMEEESLRDNFVIAYELLDEVMDFGYPQVLA